MGAVSDGFARSGGPETIQALLIGLGVSTPTCPRGEEESPNHVAMSRQFPCVGPGDLVRTIAARARSVTIVSARTRQTRGSGNSRRRGLSVASPWRCRLVTLGGDHVGGVGGGISHERLPSSASFLIFQGFCESQSSAGRRSLLWFAPIDRSSCASDNQMIRDSVGDVVRKTSHRQERLFRCRIG